MKDQHSALPAALRWSAALLLVLAALLFRPTAAHAEEYPDVMLGAFWTSDADVSDLLYLSVDGKNFYKLTTAYQDATPDDPNSLWMDVPVSWKVGTLHDPGLMYRNGYFWMNTSYSQTDTSDPNHWKLTYIPMIGYSKDLVNWSYANSGSDTNVPVPDTPPGMEQLKAHGATGFDVGAPDMLQEDDGSVWIITCFGYFAMFHGDDPQNDIMRPYLVKVRSIDPGIENPVNDPTKPPANVVYEPAKPINLPIDCDNLIDGSLYKEDGKYYLIIKKDGITNMLWRIDDLNNCSDPNAWTLICDNVQTGFEGPSLTKFGDRYYVFMDKLRGWPDSSDQDTGIWVCASDTQYDAGWNPAHSEDKDMMLWGQPYKIRAVDEYGNEITTRHGAVITVTDPQAKKLIWDLYRSKYRSDPVCESFPTLNGWVRKSFTEYVWYENGFRQGLTGRGKEIYDPASDAWYWLDAVQNGARAVSKDVYQESEGGAWADRADGTGKWVRYDWQGHMVKGWNGSYYFDPIYGTMAKGYATIDGSEFYFNTATGVKERDLGSVPSFGWKTIDGGDYWYENGIRQGYSLDTSYRGKEIYDPSSDGWYWLDNVDGGKKAVSKDVYQETKAGDWADRPDGTGKWVRYDANGRMIKGWSADGLYYFDPFYGTMAKGTVTIDGQTCTFDSATGRRIA
ncbi:MAG: hypothetical protein U0L91_00540 [Gemmiger sp.]|uniref:hypothetical protein n=1 Tax=Gemmiger sp. TaxID=2049027 RepID=UPI002E766999|nr:hypothetical protein [Gemmiger sp.]MEE0799746.1 hypothetical protein [Gemmiger sp.]